MDLAQLQQLAASVGFPDPALAAAIAMAESGGNPNAFNTEGSYGLFQIDVNFHPQFQANPNVLFDPTTNAQAAFSISNGGTNWDPWSTYRYPCTGPNTSGPPCYLQWYMPAAQQAAPATSSSSSSSSSWLPALIFAGGGLLLLGAAWRAGYFHRFA